MYTLYIKDLVVSGHHGANPGEKDRPQQFRVSVELGFAMEQASTTDDLADTLNWSRLRDTIVTTIAQTSYNLVERLAQEIVNQLLLDDRITTVTLDIAKLEAFASGVPGVRIQQTRA